MSKPLQGPELLTFVRKRLAEVELDVGELDDIDMESKIFRLGKRLGMETAYHDIEHMVAGQYGEGWTPVEEEEGNGNHDTERTGEH